MLIKASAVRVLSGRAMAIVQVSVVPGNYQSPTDQAPCLGKLSLTYSGFVVSKMQQKHGFLDSQHYNSISPDPESYEACTFLLSKVLLLFFLSYIYFFKFFVIIIMLKIFHLLPSSHFLSCLPIPTPPPSPVQKAVRVPYHVGSPRFSPPHPVLAR